MRRYTLDLLEENERLRTADAERHAEDERLQHQLHAARQALADAEALRERINELEPENARLREERSYFSAQLRAAQVALAEHEQEAMRLAQRLALTDSDNRRYADKFVTLEQQNNNLANLYVASYRLHETVERSEVIAILQEILANLVGTEEMALFEVDGPGTGLSLAASNGIDPSPLRTIPAGVGVIGRVAAGGGTFVRDGSLPPGATAAEATLNACIPLRLADRVTGVIAIFRLLPQKSRIEELDHELFDLLATHAATALYLSELHARAGGRAV
jgi:hypothetical protein